MTDLDLLRAIVGDFRKGPLFEKSASSGDPSVQSRRLGIKRGKWLFATVELMGIGAAGLHALSELASSIRSNGRSVKAAVHADVLENQLFELIFEHFRSLSPSSIDSLDLAKLKQWVLSSVSDSQFSKLFFLPCALPPVECGEISVGPVRFRHVHALPTRLKEIEEVLPQAHPADFDIIRSAVLLPGSTWFAEVEIDKRELGRAREVATLAVDLALSGLQFLFPRSVSERFVRVDGRVAPFMLREAYLTQAGIGGGSTNFFPGAGLNVEELDRALADAAPLLASVGRRIAHFVNGAGAMPTLQSAWCDATYWLHEAIAEELDAVAVAKFEVAIEQLVGAGSTSGSKNRMVRAIHAFLGLARDQALFMGYPMTVETFCSRVVEARSRILHGTHSTTSNEVLLKRSDIEVLACTLLIIYTQKLDDYVTVAEAVDSATAFLKWVETEHLLDAGA